MKMKTKIKRKKDVESIFNTYYTTYVESIFVYMELSNAALFFVSRRPICGSNVYKKPGTPYGFHMAHTLNYVSGKVKHENSSQIVVICETLWDTPKKEQHFRTECVSNLFFQFDSDSQLK